MVEIIYATPRDASRLDPVTVYKASGHAVSMHTVDKGLMAPHLGSSSQMAKAVLILRYWCPAGGSTTVTTRLRHR